MNGELVASKKMLSTLLRVFEQARHTLEALMNYGKPDVLSDAVVDQDATKS